VQHGELYFPTRILITLLHFFHSVSADNISDISQVFEVDDILGAPQAIKGFDKSDLCEVISIIAG
jgi:hypothetical protein